MLYPILLVISDFVALLAAFTVAYIIRVQVDTRPLVAEIEATTFIKAFFVLIPFWLIINAYLGLYTKSVYEKRLNELSRVLIGAFIGMLLIIGADFVTDQPLFPARLVVVYALLGSFVFLALFRNILWLLRKQMFRFGYGLRRVMIIGNNRATTDLADLLSDSDTSGYDIELLVCSKQFVPKDYAGKHVTTLTQGLAEITTLKVDSIIQTEFYEKESKNRTILEAARTHHLSYRFIPSQEDFYAARNTVDVFNGYPVVSVHQTPLIGWGRVAKRLFDILGSVLGLIILSPFLLLIALIVKATDPEGPIVYKHLRITRFNTPFYIYKFRSMRWKYSTGKNMKYKSNIDVFRAMGREDLVEEEKLHHKVKNDPRITAIGRFMRKTSIDELPQLWNVLMGDLSLVGPRAITKEELKKYKSQIGGGIVTSVKSGITGLWQVSGRSDLSYEERIRLDKYYVQNWSFWLDIKILLKTIVVLVRKTGAR